MRNKTILKPTPTIWDTVLMTSLLCICPGSIQFSSLVLVTRPTPANCENCNHFPSKLLYIILFFKDFHKRKNGGCQPKLTLPKVNKEIAQALFISFNMSSAIPLPYQVCTIPVHYHPFHVDMLHSYGMNHTLGVYMCRTRIRLP